MRVAMTPGKIIKHYVSYKLIEIEKKALSCRPGQDDQDQTPWMGVENAFLKTQSLFLSLFDSKVRFRCGWQIVFITLERALKMISIFFFFCFFCFFRNLYLTLYKILRIKIGR